MHSTQSSQQTNAAISLRSMSSIWREIESAMFRSSNENDPVSQGASGAPHDRRGEQTARVPKRLRRGLDQLRRAYEYAIDLGADAWDFAIEIRELLAAGMTRSDLRWLVRKGWTLHAREVTLPGEETRDFHRSRGLIFTRRTCFVLMRRESTRR